MLVMELLLLTLSALLIVSSLYLSSGMHGCTSNCDALPDLEEPEQETWTDDHVYRLWHGHGCHLCKSALPMSLSPLPCMFEYQH